MGSHFTPPPTPSPPGPGIARAYCSSSAAIVAFRTNATRPPRFYLVSESEGAVREEIDNGPLGQS